MSNSFRLSAFLWLLANLFLSLMTTAIALFYGRSYALESSAMIAAAGFIVSSPVILVLGLAGIIIRKAKCSDRDRYIRFGMVTCILTAMEAVVYCFVLSLSQLTPEGPQFLLLFFVIAFCSVCLAWHFMQTRIILFFQSIIHMLWKQYHLHPAF